MPRRLAVPALVVVAIGAGAAGCGNPAGPSSGCGSALSFTSLPVPFGAIVNVSPLGNFNPPAHTIPTDHAYFYLNGTGIALSAPGALRITGVRTTHYLASTFRAGQSDYSVYTSLCNGYQLTLAHIQSLVSKIQSQTGGNCQTYSTADETVQSCENDSVDLEIAAGEAIGTVGGPSSGAFDFGLYQSSHQNYFVNPSRYSGPTLTAVCPYDPFTADLRSQLDSRLSFAGYPVSGESPACGAVSVDVAGTAAGVWVMQSNPVNQAGDESPFVVLAPHLGYPQSSLSFSIGPSSLSSNAANGSTRYPASSSGRVNRRFREVTPDNQIYCYTADLAASAITYFVRLSGTVLTLQKVTHGPGASPCAADPASWAFDGTAVSFIR